MMKVLYKVLDSNVKEKQGIHSKMIMIMIYSLNCESNDKTQTPHQKYDAHTDWFCTGWPNNIIIVYSVM